MLIRGDGGGTGNDKLSCDLGMVERTTAALADVAVFFHDGLAFVTHDKVDEVLRQVADVCSGGNVEGAGDFIGTIFDVVSGGFGAVDCNGLDGVIQRAKGNIADARLVAGDSGHHDGGAVGDFGGISGIVNLVAVCIFLFDGNR